MRNKSPKFFRRRRENSNMHRETQKDQHGCYESSHYVRVTEDTLKDAQERYESYGKGELHHGGRAISKVSFFSNIEDMAERRPLLHNPSMAAGKPVPPELGSFPKNLLGRPVNEIDPALKTKRTFIVVSKRFGSTKILRFSNSRALYLLSPLHPIRKFTLRVLSHQLFDLLVIVTILVNCVFMALDQPITNYWEEINPLIEKSPTAPPPTRLHLDIAEYSFTAIYVTEMLVKVFSRGFVLSKYSYLRDSWNWLDFTVIILAFVTFGLQLAQLDSGNFAVLRSFRVLRALKTISIIPGLKVIIDAFLGSMRMLMEVILLTMFVLLVFSLLALQSFMGTLLQKCVSDMDNSQMSNVSDQYWYDFVQNSSNWLVREDSYVVCSNISIVGQEWSACPSSYQCLPDIGDNPNGGYTNFDNMFWSMVTGFQLITLDYWEDVYNLIIAAQGPLAMLFFMLTSMLGPFYLINLMLAVVAMSYTEEMKNSKKELERKMLNRKKSVLDLDTHKLMRLIGEKQKKKQQKRRETRTTMDVTKEGHDLAASVNTVSENVPMADGTLEKDSEDVDDPVTTEPKRESVVGNAQGSPHVGKAAGPKVDCCPSRCCSFCRGVFICPRVIHRSLGKLQVVCQWVVLDPLLDLFITIVILLNTLCLSLDHYQIGETFDYVLSVGNTICTVIFCLECALKLCALGYSFFKNNWNNFDLFIVITSLAEIPLQGVQGLSVLRTFRLLRVLKLAQSWTTMRVLLSIISSSISAVANVSVVLVIVVYIFAIIGMQLFGENYTSEYFPDGVPRWNFVDFPHSIMLIFRILCGEWIEPLYDCMDCSNTGLCITVFISTLMVGNILILNLFLALLLNSFATDSLKKEEDSRLRLAFAKLRRAFLRVFQSFCCLSKSNPSNKVEDTTHARRSVTESTQTNKPYKGDGTVGNAGRSGAFVFARENLGRESSLHAEGVFNESFEMNESVIGTRATHRLEPIAGLPTRHMGANRRTAEDHRDGTAPSNRKISTVLRPVSTSFSVSQNSETGEIEAKLADGAEEEADSIQSENASLHVATESPVQPCCPNPIHRWCIRQSPCLCYKPPGKSKTSNIWTVRKTTFSVVQHQVFEWTILVCIFISSSILVFEDIYLDERTVFKEVLRIMNYIFVCVFIVEMLLKWIGLGFKTYFTNFWCLLDFVIVCISVTGVAAELFNLNDIGAFRSLRTLRALRPLRAISRWQGMKIVVNALAFAIPSIANVLLVCIMFWLIFAIIGVQFFRGTFYRCTDDQGDLVPIDVVNNMTECLELDYTWSNSKIHFDNVYYAVIALFQVATFEGWIEIMESAIDNRGIDMQPSREFSFHSYIFFVVFIVFGSFFFLNLFIGVIIDNFNKLKRKYEGDRTLDMFMTSSQKNYYQTMRKLGNKKPRKQIKPPQSKFLAFCYKLTTSTKFEVAIVFVILLNMVAMMIEHYRMSDTLKSALDITNIVFTVIFVLEAALKIIALRWSYFKSPWNTFDFIVVLLSLLGILLSDVMSAFLNPTLLRVFRLLRIGRILRLVKSAKGLRKLLFALIISLPALFNIGCLLFLVIFIFAIIGMSQFAHVKLEGALDEVVNFQTWTKSMLLLFRVSTSAGWNDILDALMTDGPPDCDPEYGGLPNGNCGNTVFAFVFFLAFLVFSFLIIINTYIAVILENFSAAHAQEEVGITEDDFGMFYKTWERYDPNATQFILIEQLSDFCDDLELPLKLAKPNEIKLAGLNLPVYFHAKMHCLDVLFTLTKRVLADVEENEDFAELQKQMTEQFKSAFPSLERIQPTTTTMQLNKEHKAAKRLQRAWRMYKTKMEILRATRENRKHISNMSSNDRNTEADTVGASSLEHRGANQQITEDGLAQPAEPRTPNMRVASSNPSQA